MTTRRMLTKDSTQWYFSPLLHLGFVRTGCYALYECHGLIIIFLLCLISWRSCSTYLVYIGRNLTTSVSAAFSVLNFRRKFITESKSKLWPLVQVFCILKKILSFIIIFFQVETFAIENDWKINCYLLFFVPGEDYPALD